MRLYRGLTRPYQPRVVGSTAPDFVTDFTDCPYTPLQHRRRERGHHSTRTVNDAGQLVPWLAATGPLAYKPEEPPDLDYFFQYSWILPGIFAERTNKRRHFYFGASHKGAAADLFAFWEAARRGTIRRVLHCRGSIGPDRVTAPLAVYMAASNRRGTEYLFLQHGSYQLIRAADQPLVESAEVFLYRGIQAAPTFRLLRLDDLAATRRALWRRYLAVQGHVLSDAVRSFNSIHDRASRCETGHIRDRSWMTDDVAREQGLDIDGGGFGADLWKFTHQSFALARWVAEHKFGRNYVVCKTPASNIRLTTFFAGEHEARVIDPGLLEITEVHGCRVEYV